MITQFNDVPIRDSAVIYAGNFEQIKEVYQDDPALAGELAISLCEMALTGQASTSNRMIHIILANFKVLSAKNAEKWNKTVDKKKSAQIAAQKLDEIADYYKRGYKQVEIAKIMGISTSTISDRIRKIRMDFPDLLEFGKNPDPENSDEIRQIQSDTAESPDFIQAKNPENPENPAYVNVNVNVNDNVKSNKNKLDWGDQFQF